MCVFMCLCMFIYVSSGASPLSSLADTPPATHTSFSSLPSPYLPQHPAPSTQLHRALTMAKLLARSNQQNVYKKVGLALLALFTLFVLYHGSAPVSSAGGSSSARGSNGVVSSDRQYKSKPNNFVYTEVKDPKYTGKKVKATFVTLARNSDLVELLPAIKDVEDRFNHKFQYDWVFLNDEEFTEEFKNVTSQFISGNTKYGLIPKEHWSIPSWIDPKKASDARQKMAADKIIYGGSLSYRHMCRFESGFFFQHPLMDEYQWYWRVEPGIKLHCDIDYDIFKFMEDNDKKYGFAISIREYEATIKTLWKTTRQFIEENPKYLHPNNMMDFISDDNGLSYNLCHFWSNFEIASLDFWRSPAYMDYFNYLDQNGGFFYERWGDAPVHSIAAALFLDREQIHFFEDVGYYHGPFHSCPVDDEVRLRGKCACDIKKDFTWNGYSCTTKFFTVNNMKKPQDWQLYVNNKL